MNDVCYGQIIIRGEPVKIGDLIATLFNSLDASMDLNFPHFYGILRVDLEDKARDKTTDIHTWTFGIECIHSILHCMFDYKYPIDEIGGSYYYEDKLKNPNTKGTTILLESARLGIDVEIFSFGDTDGHCDEHYFISNGVLAYAESTDSCKTINLNSFSDVYAYNRMNPKYMLSENEFNYYKQRYRGYYHQNSVIPYCPIITGPSNQKLLCSTIYDNDIDLFP